MKVAKWLLISLSTILLLWYFFIKDYQHKITFQSKHPTGLLFQHVRDWAGFQRSVDSVKTIAVVPFSEVTQKVFVNDSVFEYRWRFEKIDDSLSEVILYASDEKNGLLQKLQTPFVTNSFEKKNITNAKDVVSSLKNFSKDFKVHDFEKTTVPSTFCVYVPITSKSSRKGAEMFNNIPIPMGYIKSNNLELTGDPFIEITEWDVEKATISYNFCFPIKNTDTLPTLPEKLKTKTTTAFNALQVEFNGNYRISEKAWYYLLDYAKTNNLKVKELPVEYFREDPHQGGDPLKWKADIYLPLEE